MTARDRCAAGGTGTAMPTMTLLAIGATVISGGLLAAIRLSGARRGAHSDTAEPAATKSAAAQPAAAQGIQGVAASAAAESGSPGDAPTGQYRSPLPAQLSPLPRHQIWSDHGGSWHPLNLRSREVYRDSGSGSGWAIAGVSTMAVFCAASELTEAAHAHHLQPLTAAAFLGLPAAVLAAVTARAVHRRKLPKRLVLQGKVAHCWQTAQPPPAASTASAARAAVRGSCILDVGRAPASVCLNLNIRTYQTLRVGDLVEVALRPRRGRISGLRNLGAESDGGTAPRPESGGGTRPLADQP